MLARLFESAADRKQFLASKAHIEAHIEGKTVEIINDKTSTPPVKATISFGNARYSGTGASRKTAIARLEDSLITKKVIPNRLRGA